MKIKAYDAFNFVTVYKILSYYPTGEVKDTKEVGFARRTRPIQADEQYSAISTSLTDERRNPKFDHENYTIELLPFIE